MQKGKIKKRNLNEKENSGITLIALVITIVVLLILASTAVTIGLNGGELFEKTENSVSKWNEKVANEETSVQNALDILDMAANPDLAKYKLEVKVNYDENGNETTVESPYYVWYPSAKFINESTAEGCKGIKCRVLYNDSTYGLQIISVDSVTTVELGKNDTDTNIAGTMGTVERAQNSYNRAITTLNEKAEEYIETSDGSVLATDARCVGSDPLNKNYPDNLTGEARDAEMYTSGETYMNEYNGKFFKGKITYSKDKGRLRAIGAWAIEKYYWLASRLSYNNSFSVYFVSKNGIGNNSIRIWNVNSEGVAEAETVDMEYRPVFTLVPNIKVLRGVGTEEEPFEIGL